jgi:hypothetical protein
MSAKSTGHSEVHTQGLVSRKTVLVSVIVVVAIFFTIISYYPLIFSSEKSGQKSPVTDVK